MKPIHDSRLIAILALGVACFAAGFSMTASAYAELASSDERESEVGASTVRSERACASASE